jgi:hypothetical protein
MSGQLHALAVLLPGKEPPVPLNRRPGEPQSRTGHSEEEKNLLPVKRIKPRQPSPSLYRLSYPEKLKNSTFQIKVSTVVRSKRVLWTDNCNVTHTRV